MFCISTGPLGHCVFAVLLLVSIGVADEVDFSRQALPILSDKCFLCHGPDARKKDPLRLDSYEGATTDRDGVLAIDPGDLAGSELIARIHDTEDPMPPQKADNPISEAERDILTRWVKQGGTYSEHWAFVPPKKETPPANTLPIKHPIDAFINDALHRKGITLAREADKATRARRAALTLTGLPLAPDALDTHLKDHKPGAYERLIDVLLTTPAYAELQARYWLDAVRYGDTHGLHLDNKRGILAYRDWVVHAFNRNLPLDDFITWQLAGDLLPSPLIEQQVATGFIRMNPSTSEGVRLRQSFRPRTPSTAQRTSAPYCWA